MNIAVCIKQTPDTTTRVQIADDGKSIVEDSIQWIISPYDEFAIEEALQLAEKHGGEVTIVSLGPARVEKTIREALAMGAQHAIRIDCDTIPEDPGVTAQALADVLKDRGFDLIFTGRQGIDGDHAQVPGRLAHLLGWSCASVVIELNIEGEKGTALREVEGGSERVEFTMPAVIGANRHLNEPRYRNMRGIMKAKRIPIEVVQPEMPDAQLEITAYVYPPQKGERKLFEGGANDVAEVVRLLREEAQVI